MVEKDIEVNGKKFHVRELFAVEIDNIDFNDKVNAIKKQIILSTGISEEEYNKLTIKERLKIIQAINQINALEDFQ